jgi:hypothetical protein
VKTQCKWCRQVLNGNWECYEKFQCVRNLIDRERRIVRVYYRVRDDKVHEVMAEDWRPDAMRWKHRGYAVFKVTVRRKAKK